MPKFFEDVKTLRNINQTFDQIIKKKQKIRKRWSWDNEHLIGTSGWTSSYRDAFGCNSSEIIRKFIQFQKVLVKRNSVRPKVSKARSIRFFLLDLRLSSEKNCNGTPCRLWDERVWKKIAKGPRSSQEAGNLFATISRKKLKRYSRKSKDWNLDISKEIALVDYSVSVSRGT